jgi:hypothetical protein
VTEVAQAVDGGEGPVVSSDEGCVSSGGRTNNSRDNGISNNENLWMYTFGASTITVGRIKVMVEKGNFADGEAQAPGQKRCRAG